MPNLLLVHGPNLNMLGRREKEHYGSFTLDDVVKSIKKLAEEEEYTVLDFQSNHEGELLDFIQSHLESIDGMLINAGAFTHYSYALYDCLKLCPYPIWEVHISDVENREDFRKVSVIRPACTGTVSGYGFQSYERAFHELMAFLKKTNDSIKG